jgi:hypothetical protein
MLGNHLFCLEHGILLEKDYLIQLPTSLNINSIVERQTLLLWSIKFDFPDNFVNRSTPNGTLSVIKDGQGCRIPLR